MIRLRTLGTIDLTGADGQPLDARATQPKRLGLLTYLALARPRSFHRRDTLLGLFWPDQDDSHARGSLNVALHHLRRSVGSDAIVTRGGDQVGLDREQVWCDAVAFDEAVAAGSFEEALELYGGDLLPGFFLSGTEEFEQWLELERGRLREAARASAVGLVERMERAGRLAEATRWARRALALSPTDERATRKLLTVLDAAGERAGALRVYEEFAQRLRDELGVEPAPETAALVAEIRAREEPRAAPAAPPPALSANAADADSAAWAGTASASAAGARKARVTARVVQALGGRRRAAAAGAVAAIAVWLIGGVVWSGGDDTLGGMVARAAAGEPVDAGLLGPGGMPRSGRTTVAVLPFVVRGGSDVAYLGEGMVDLLSTKLDGAGSLRTVDPRALFSRLERVDGALTELERARAVAQHFDARYALLGSVIGAGDRLQLTASLYERDGGGMPVARATAPGSADSVFDIVDDLVRQLIAGLPGGPAGRLERLAASTTGSLPALRSYLDGERLFRAGRFVEAFDAFRLATERDSTFALAFYRASQSATWAGPWDATGPMGDRAMALSGRLSQHDASLLQAWHAYREGDVENAYRTYRRILADHPEDIDSWFGVGEIVFHWGAPLGWPLVQSRAMWERVLFLQPDDAGALLHLSKVAAAEGRLAELDTLLDRSMPLGSSPDLLEVRLLHALATADSARRMATVAALTTGQEVPMGMVRGVAAFADPAAALALLRGMDWPTPAGRAEAVSLEVMLEAARGRWRAAVDASAALPAARGLEFRAALAILPFRSVPAAELRALRDSLRALERTAERPASGTALIAAAGVNEPRRLYLLGMLSLRLGEDDDALGYARTLDTFAGTAPDPAFARRFARTIEAAAEHGRGTPKRALELLGPPAVEPDMTPTGPFSYPLAYEIWLRAEALHDVGRSDDALRWFDAFRHHTAFALPWVAAAHLRSARIQAALGRADEAARDSARFVELRSDADAEAHPDRDVPAGAVRR